MGQFVSHTLFDDAYTLLRFHDLTTMLAGIPVAQPRSRRQDNMNASRRKEVSTWESFSGVLT